MKAVTAVWLAVAALSSYLFFRKQYPGPAAIPVLTEKDNGSTVTVKAGSPIALSLSTNASTGYGWDFSITSDRMFLDPVLKSTSVGPIMPGSPSLETRLWKTTPAMVGTHRIQLEYRQPWMKNAMPAKTFSFVAVVVP